MRWSLPWSLPTWTTESLSTQVQHMSTPQLKESPKTTQYILNHSQGDPLRVGDENKEGTTIRL